jgi:hypothetical protein
MNNDEKRQVQSALEVAKENLQKIEAGQDYILATEIDLDERRQKADWQLCWLLHKIIPALPKDLRAEVQACHAANERVWSKEYQERYFLHKKKARSERLATANEPLLDL